MLATAGVANADDPKFKYGKSKDVKDVKGVEWKASAQAGMIVTSGNARTTTIAGSAKTSRKTADNKFQFELNGAFARSAVLVSADANGDGLIGSENEITRSTATSAEAWAAKARYDRFLTASNSLYVAGIVSADQPAGKELVGGGQLGYSRLIYKDKKHTLLGEVGYDFSFEDLAVGDGVSIHSGRVFLGYEGKLTKDTGLASSLEVLANVNELDQAGRIVDPLEDTRVNAAVNLTTKLFKNISFRFGVTAKYDNAPAPRPALDLPYAPGFVSFAEELDTRTEATLIINFL